MRNLPTRLRAGCLSLLALSVLGESGVRVWEHFHGETGSLYDCVVPVANRFKLRPSTTITVPERYGDIVYHLNRRGYRDDEPDTGSGVRRIVLLGDSVAFGLGVDQDRIFAALLERRLRDETGRPWDVDNLAIFAYQTANELAALEEDGLQLRPELVLVQFYMNDFSIFSPAGGAAPPRSLIDRLTALKNRLVYRSAFYRRLHQAGAGLAYLALHDARRRWFTESLNDAEPRGEFAMLASTPDDGRIAAFRALSRIREVARSAGARTLVLLTPDEVQLYTSRYDGINRRIAAFCRRQGIDLYDPLPALRTSPDRRSFYLDGVHLTPQGHRRMADLLFAELRSRDLVGGPPRP
jgi:lysophospholipase L1-like esterase